MEKTITPSFSNKRDTLKVLLFSKFSRKTIVEIISYLYILLLVYAAFSKIIDFQKFKFQLGQSPILTNFAIWIAILIPLIEIIISVMLSLSKFKLLGLYASFSLMVLFTSYIIAITNFSDYIPCSCGGILQDMSWNQHLIFNIGFVALSIIAILLHTEK